MTKDEKRNQLNGNYFYHLRISYSFSLKNKNQHVNVFGIMNCFSFCEVSVHGNVSLLANFQLKWLL